MAYKVALSETAEADLDEILAWLIERHAGLGGLRWFEELESAVYSLREFPQRCPLVKRDWRVKFEARELFYGKKPHVFRILFRIIDEQVIVLRIRRGNQSPAKLH
jgi:plasmid stabilization system protein ParE